MDHPVSLYAATKQANELMAHSYAHLFGLRATGLRFFTVYGPWGRPDMALFMFTKGILAGEPIEVFNQGEMVRDFTYIDDIVEGVVRVIDNPAAPGPVVRQQTRSGDQLRAVPDLQHRQQQSGAAHALHRGAGAVPRQEGQARPAADAAGGRGGDRGGYFAPVRGRGLQAARRRWRRGCAGLWNGIATTTRWRDRVPLSLGRGAGGEGVASECPSSPTLLPGERETTEGQ